MSTKTTILAPVLPYHECTLEDPRQHHFCQIHQEESSLTANAVRYLQMGAVNGENLLMITSKTRQSVIKDWLKAAGVNVGELLAKKRFFSYTSREVIEMLFVDGMPDWETFVNRATGMLDEATWDGAKRVRFYGDAVSDLWTSGNHAGAIALEDFWTRLQQQKRYDVAYFCGYVIDALSPRSYSSHLEHLGRPHCFVMPSKDSIALAGALNRAGREVLGITLSEAVSKQPSPNEAWRVRLPLVFQAAMWLNEAHPTAVNKVLARAKSIYSV